MREWNDREYRLEPARQEQHMAEMLADRAAAALHATPASEYLQRAGGAPAPCQAATQDAAMQD